MIELPRIRIELQSMKQTIEHAFAGYHDECSRAVSEQLQSVVDNFDFGAAVRAQAEACLSKSIREAIENYFSYGDGRRELNKIIESAMRPILVDVSKKVRRSTRE